jgi:hypothetical protein
MYQIQICKSLFNRYTRISLLLYTVQNNTHAKYEKENKIRTKAINCYSMSISVINIIIFSISCTFQDSISRWCGVVVVVVVVAVVLGV